MLLNHYGEIKLISYPFINNKSIEEVIANFKGRDNEKLENNPYYLALLMYRAINNEDFEGLKALLDVFEEQLDDFSIYENYYYYYFYGLYFTLYTKNYSAAEFAFNHVNLDKYKRYIKVDHRDFFLGLMYNDLGAAYTIFGKFEKSNDYLESGISVFRKMKKQDLVESTLLNLGQNYLSSGDLATAYSFYRRMNREDLAEHYICLFNMVLIKAVTDNRPLALRLFRKLESEFITDNTSDDVKYDIYGLGVLVHFLNDNNNKALVYYKEYESLGILIGKNNSDYYFVLKALIFNDNNLETIEAIKNDILPRLVEKHDVCKMKIVDIYFEKK